MSIVQIQNDQQLAPAAGLLAQQNNVPTPTNDKSHKGTTDRESKPLNSMYICNVMKSILTAGVKKFTVLLHLCWNIAKKECFKKFNVDAQSCCEKFVGVYIWTAPF